MSAADTINSVNSFLQSLIVLCVVAGICVAGWFGYEQWHQGERLVQYREKLRRVETDLQSERQRSSKLQAQVEKLDTALHLIKVDHRLAEIRVLQQSLAPGNDRVWTEIEFVEIGLNGREIDQPKRFTIEGDKVYVDYWVVKFADNYVERAEINRATSICLFRGIHGEYQTPADAFRLDAVGSLPAAYSRGKPMSDFEQQIWSDFWEFANNPELAWEKGIRAAHGEEPYTAVREGMTYRLELRASGGLSITPVGSPSRVQKQRSLATSRRSTRSRMDVARRPFVSNSATSAPSESFTLRR